MESKNLSLLNERIAFLDYIRVIACLLVMVIHTCSRFLIGGDIAHPLLPVWLAIPVIALLTFMCCAVTTKLISQIPGSKYLIG